VIYHVLIGHFISSLFLPSTCSLPHSPPSPAPDIRKTLRQGRAWISSAHLLIPVYTVLEHERKKEKNLSRPELDHSCTVQVTQWKEGRREGRKEGTKKEKLVPSMHPEK